MTSSAHLHECTKPDCYFCYKMTDQAPVAYSGFKHWFVFEENIIRKNITLDLSELTKLITSRTYRQVCVKRTKMAKKLGYVYDKSSFNWYKK